MGRTVRGPSCGGERGEDARSRPEVKLIEGQGDSAEEDLRAEGEDEAVDGLAAERGKMEGDAWQESRVEAETLPGRSGLRERVEIRPTTRKRRRAEPGDDR